MKINWESLSVWVIMLFFVSINIGVYLILDNKKNQELHNLLYPKSYYIKDNYRISKAFNFEKNILVISIKSKSNPDEKIWHDAFYLKDLDSIQIIKLADSVEQLANKQLSEYLFIQNAMKKIKLDN